MSGSNIDTSDDNNDPTRHTGTQNSGDIDGNNNDGDKEEEKEEEYSSPDHNQQYSTPERWILVLAITILASGVVLLTLRSVIFSLIFLTIGISLFAYWLYLGVRSREQYQSLPGYVSSSAFKKRGARETELVCTCSVCKHSESRSCMERKCPCCILTRNKQIIGHFNNPLQ